MGRHKRRNRLEILYKDFSDRILEYELNICNSKIDLLPTLIKNMTKELNNYKKRKKFIKAEINKRKKFNKILESFG